jgi:hypothetical protein
MTESGNILEAAPEKRPADDSVSDPEKLIRFLAALDRLISAYSRNSRLGLSDHVDQFYYMSKREELRLLAEQIAEVEKRLELLRGQFGRQYHDVFCRWQRDARWLQRNDVSRKEDTNDINQRSNQINEST